MDVDNAFSQLLGLNVNGRFSETMQLYPMRVSFRGTVHSGGPIVGFDGVCELVEVWAQTRGFGVPFRQARSSSAWRSTMSSCQVWASPRVRPVLSTQLPRRIGNDRQFGIAQGYDHPLAGLPFPVAEGFHELDRRVSHLRGGGIFHRFAQSTWKRLPNPPGWRRV